MPAIFISHSSLDKEAAVEIMAELDRLGFEKVFLAFDIDHGIPVGENWEKRLYENLARCHAVILVLTPNWLKSTWCQIEFRQARALGKTILPIVCAPLEGGRVLPEIQAADFVDWGAGGLQRLERSLLAITAELARGFSLPPTRPPYPGIYAFEAEDAAIYFGRDEETRAVIEKLDARRNQGGARLVVVIGASGAGKSSLLKAGVLPQLKRRRGQWMPLPPMRPEKAPLEALAKGLAELAGTPTEWRAWHERLKGPDALHHVAELTKDLRVGEARAAIVLLPFDQFEEVFTIADPEERAGFLRGLAAILDPACDLPVLAIATGRADVLQGLLEKSELAKLIEPTSLTPMPLDRVPRLVEGPAAVAALTVEKGLPERIMRDVENPEALPLLAYMLRLLHDRCGDDKRLTLAAYLGLGDPARGLNPVQNAVRLGADEAIAAVKPVPEEMAALRDAFIPHLVRLRLDDKRHVRAPAALAALPPAAERLVRALIEARLLSARTENGAPVVEVAHEALFSAWPTLKEWLDAEQDFLADIERLKGAHETWTLAPEAHKPQALLSGLLLVRARDWLVKHPQRFLGRGMEPLRAFIADSATAADAEQARARRLRRRMFQAVGAAAIVFFAAFVATGWLYFEATRQRGEAERQRGIAESQTTLAVQREQEARHERQEAERQQKEAERQRDRAEQNFRIAKQAADDVVFKLAQGLRNVAGMRVESVRKILDAAQALMDQLVKAAPDDHDLQRSRSSMLNEFVDTYLAAGDLTRAQAAAEESLAIMRKLAAVDPGNTGWQRDVSMSLHKVGDVRFAAGDRTGALAAYEEALAIRRKLAAADPGNTGWQSDVSVSLNKIGDVRFGAGDRKGALAAYEESLRIGRKLAAADPGNAGWQYGLSDNLLNIGDVRFAAGDQAGALAAYEESLKILRNLVAADPGNAGWQRDLTLNLTRIGDARLAAGDRTGALGAYEEALAIRRKLAAADPGNTELQHNVSTGLEKIGTVRLAMDDQTGALAAFDEALAIMRKLAESDLGNARWQYDLGTSLDKVGDGHVAAGERMEALDAFAESLAIMRKLAAADPGNAQWQRDVTVSLSKVGDVRLDIGDRKGALDAYEESLTIRRKLAAADPGNAWRQAELAIGLYKISTASDPKRARQVLGEALAILEALAREDKLTADEKQWLQTVRNALAKLPPEKRPKR